MPDGMTNLILVCPVEFSGRSLRALALGKHGYERNSQTLYGRPRPSRMSDEFRLEGDEVRISKVGDKVILEPIKKPMPVDPDGAPD